MEANCFLQVDISALVVGTNCNKDIVLLDT